MCVAFCSHLLPNKPICMSEVFCIANQHYLSVIFSFLLASNNRFKGSILSFLLGMSTQKPYFVSHLQLKMINISHPNYVLHLWSSLAVLPSLPHSLFYSLSLSLIIRPSFYLKPPTAIVFHRDDIQRKNKHSTAFYAVKERNFN